MGLSMGRPVWVGLMLAAGASLGICDVVAPDSVIFSRPLPIININSSNPNLRSNWSISTIPTPPNDPLVDLSMLGDDFTLNPSSPSYLVNSISTWSVGSTLGEAMGNEFSSVSLWIRPMYTDPVTGAQFPAGPFTRVATGTPNTYLNPGTNVDGDSNPNDTHTNVTYIDGQNYQSASGTQFPLWENTFSNLDLTLLGGVTYEFAVWGLGWYNNDTPCTSDFQCMDPSDGYGYWYNEFSNALLSGRIEQGADNFYLSFVTSDLAAPQAAINAAQNGVAGVPVDQNIVITGAALAVPEPATYGVVAAGLLAIGLFSRRRRK
ncbi:MAG: PEP-CTERM sorting domain-containing protein [Acidobacteriia bacterium]|nr:PEP-CTERM sorting domain-containing protein [Terriglobia bacterium]